MSDSDSDPESQDGEYEVFLSWDEERRLAQQNLNKKLIQAASTDNCHSVKSLLDERANPRVALDDAISGGHTQIVELLVEYKAYVSVIPSSTLYFDRKEILRLLLSNKASANEGSPIRAAIEGGHISSASQLIDHKADVNVSDGYCLKFASKVFDKEMVKILLTAKANPTGISTEFRSKFLSLNNFSYLMELDTCDIDMRSILGSDYEKYKIQRYNREFLVNLLLPPLTNIVLDYL